MEKIKFDAPRILNAPPVWRFSHLKNAATPASASKLREVITGVRLAVGRIRSAAARTSSKVTSVVTSISSMFVHHVLERLAFAKTLEILDKELHCSRSRLRTPIRGVRREQHIFQGVERMAGGQRLGRENVQRGAAKVSGFKRRKQRRLIDHGSAPDVDDHRRRLHRGELRRADHPARLASQ